MTPEEWMECDEMIRRALAEDFGTAGDVTSLAILPAEGMGNGRFLAKSAGIVAGLEMMKRVFQQLDERVVVECWKQDGDAVQRGDLIATASGPVRALLGGERVALNFMQRMSGIATLTNQFCQATAGTKAVILDTRKTVPGLRLVDKWAVRLGGGQNHRHGLYDMALIKDNHIAAAGSITTAVARVRATTTPAFPVEVEVKNLTELQEALALPVDRIMLDNMSLADMAEAVQIANGRIPLEASGNVNLETITAIAQTGVNFISIGALTHSVKALDISFLL